jgi:hypothetical protein
LLTGTVEPVVLDPGRVRRIGVQVLAADLVMLPTDHSPQPREEALGEVGVDAVPAIGFRMVDAMNVERRLQKIPVRHLVGRDRRPRRDPLPGKAHALGLAQECARQRSPAPLAERDDDPAFPAAVPQETAVDTILACVGGPDMAAACGTVDFDFTFEMRLPGLGGHRLTQFVHQHERGLVLDVQVP